MGLKGKLHLWKECQHMMLLLSTKGGCRYRGQRTLSGGEQGVEGTEQDTGAQ